MKIKNISTIIALSALAMGCATNNYNLMSQGSGIPESALLENCKGISCSYDELKGNVQASYSDISSLMAINGNETRTIQFTWVSGSKNIHVDLYRVLELYSEWAFVESAEIYVGKEVVAEISGSVDRIVGTYDNILKEHEKIEVLSGLISIEQAEKIASAEYKNVAIRFYGKNGYKDKFIGPRTQKLINVVRLAKSA